SRDQRRKSADSELLHRRGRPSMAWSARQASLKVDPMQMHQIRYFLALCAERNFTRAARRSGVSQPSLTNAIAVLEKELGGALFNRRPAVALTALGNAVFPHFERIGEHAKHAAEVARVLTHSRATQSDASVPNQSEPRHDAASPRPAELPGY